MNASGAEFMPESALVPASEGYVALAWDKALWLYLMLASALGLAVFPPSAGALAVSTLLGVITLCAGHSVGLHRGVIHQTYRCSRTTQNLLLYLFVHTGLGGPLSWIRLHHVRDHYQNASECPRYFGYTQSLARDYWWNLHLRFHPQDPTRYGVPESQLADPYLRFLERTWPVHVLGLGVALWAWCGIEVALSCVSLRVAVSILGHWYVGFMAHKHGRVRYDIEGAPEVGRNLPLLGVLSFGEGFHNNHHANPGSARMGETRLEFDLGWQLVALLEKLGIVCDVRATGRSPNVRKPNARLRSGGAAESAPAS